MIFYVHLDKKDFFSAFFLSLLAGTLRTFKSARQHQGIQSVSVHYLWIWYYLRIHRCTLMLQWLQLATLPYVTCNLTVGLPLSTSASAFNYSSGIQRIQVTDCMFLWGSLHLGLLAHPRGLFKTCFLHLTEKQVQRLGEKWASNLAAVWNRCFKDPHICYWIFSSSKTYIYCTVKLRLQTETLSL